MTNQISLITATGGRQEAFHLLEGYISRQKFKGSIQWIVVDDCIPRTITTMGQECFYPPWIWHTGDNTQAANMILALDHVRCDKVLIIEDDEYYGPEYVDTMSYLLDSFSMVGEGLAQYYNVIHRRYHRFKNHQHACFARTGFTKDRLLLLKETLYNYMITGWNRIDVNMWLRAGEDKLIFVPNDPISVGIKGMPGRAGINGQHKKVPGYFKHDPVLTYLKWLIGEDAENYRGYMVQ